MLKRENTNKDTIIEHTPMGTNVVEPKFHKNDMVKVKEDVFVAYMNLVKGTELKIIEALDDNMYKVETNSSRFVRVSGDNLEKI